MLVQLIKIECLSKKRVSFPLSDVHKIERPKQLQKSQQKQPIS